MPYQKKTLRKRAALDMDNSFEDEAEKILKMHLRCMMHLRRQSCAVFLVSTFLILIFIIFLLSFLFLFL